MRNTQTLFCIFDHTFRHMTADLATVGRNPLESRQQMISVLMPTNLHSDNLVQRVPSRFGHSHFSYSQQITSITSMCEMWEFASSVSRSRSKTSVLTGRNRHLWPREARGQMLPEILGCAVCHLWTDYWNSYRESHHKGQKGNLLLDICLQEIKVWMKRTMWITFISPSSGKCFAYDRQLFFLFVFFLKEEIWFSSLAKNENILFACFARKSVFFLFFF